MADTQVGRERNGSRTMLLQRPVEFVPAGHHLAGEEEAEQREHDQRRGSVVDPGAQCVRSSPARAAAARGERQARRRLRPAFEHDLDLPQRILVVVGSIRDDAVHRRVDAQPSHVASFAVKNADVARDAGHDDA